jgi:DNA-binding IclR family transcriptional regulator
MRKPSRPQRGVQSVEIGVRVAQSLARAGKPATLGEIAKIVALSPSKTHRYLVSLVRSGLVAQDSRDQRYWLSGAAIYLGLAAQYALDEYQLLTEAIERLHHDTGHAVAVMIWSTSGPMVVRSLEPLDQPIMVVARIGANITMTNSASGRLFAAFMESKLVKPLLEKEFRSGVISAATNKPVSRADFAEILARVRAERFASVNGVYRSGYSTISVPVFRQRDELLFAITIIAPSSVLDLRPSAPTVRALKDCANSLEARLGQQAST